MAILSNIAEGIKAIGNPLTNLIPSAPTTSASITSSTTLPASAIDPVVTSSGVISPTPSGVPTSVVVPPLTNANQSPAPIPSNSNENLDSAVPVTSTAQPKPKDYTHIPFIFVGVFLGIAVIGCLFIYRRRKRNANARVTTPAAKPKSSSRVSILPVNKTINLQALHGPNEISASSPSPSWRNAASIIRSHRSRTLSKITSQFSKRDSSITSFGTISEFDHEVNDVQFNVSNVALENRQHQVDDSPSAHLGQSLENAETQDETFESKLKLDNWVLSEDGNSRPTSGLPVNYF